MKIYSLRKRKGHAYQEFGRLQNDDYLCKWPLCKGPSLVRRLYDLVQQFSLTLDTVDVSTGLFQELLHVLLYKFGPYLAVQELFQALCSRDLLVPRIELGLFRPSVLLWYYLAGPQNYVLYLP